MPFTITNRFKWSLTGFIIFTLFFTAFGERGLFKIYKLNKEYHRLQTKRTFLEKNNILLSQNIQKMKKERAFQERSARETLGFVQDNEIVYEFAD